MKYLVVIICVLGTLPSPSLSFLGYGAKKSSEESSESDSSSIEDEFEGSPKSSKSCPAVALGGVEWILHIRQTDYGWKENTHRAIIALAVGGWKSLLGENERLLMEQQLEVEITKALLRNKTSAIYPNNLALYIHALIAINRNPRNFHGIDLIGHLLEFVEYSYDSHPFLMLVLCNSRSLLPRHVNILEKHLIGINTNRQNTEYKAIALHAYECAGSLNMTINVTLVHLAQQYLVKLQYPDGGFGNLYTTALIVQALSSLPDSYWNKAGAISYLKQESILEVNMVSAYLVQLALKANKVRFIKDLYPDLSTKPASVNVKSSTHFVQYSLKIGANPDVRHTITIKVPKESNFFEVMKLCSESDPKYNFSYYMDKNSEPSVYAISNVPNDAEENFYWRLCLQSASDPSSRYKTIRSSPVKLIPRNDDHMIYWYNDKECEE